MNKYLLVKSTVDGPVVRAIESEKSKEKIWDEFLYFIGSLNRGEMGGFYSFNVIKESFATFHLFELNEFFRYTLDIEIGNWRNNKEQLEIQ